MERIGRYEIVRELGRGSMSIVYEGFDGRIDRHLAIKVLRGRFAGDVNARQRFMREARAAGGLAHPNIVTVFDVGQVDGKPYLVMELLPGGSLEDWLGGERLDRLDIERILDVALQLARALDYAHRNGIVHRDIKPANIHYDHATGQVKMMDFGIAAIERGASPENRYSDVAGTPSHMAPELIRGQGATERSDLYALGVVLYQLLSGRLPFDGGDCAEVLKQALAHDTQPLRPLRPDTPREMIDLTHRLMALDVEARPLNARQLAEEIEEIIDGRRRGLLRGFRRQSAAWRWPVAVVLVVALVLIFGLNHIFTSQKQAMAEVTWGYGDALASLVAQETAESLILEDATALSLLVDDFGVNREVMYLHVSDQDGTVQASTNPFLKGEQVPAPDGMEVEREDNSVRLHVSSEGVLEFAVPVRFQARRVGEIRLGLDGSGLQSAARSTMSMLIAVFSVALAAVLLGLAWITRRNQTGLKRLAWGLKRLQRGQYEFRFDEDRRDEFTGASRAFNRLAMRLEEQRQAERRNPVPATPARTHNEDDGDRDVHWPANADPGGTLVLGNSSSDDDGGDEPSPEGGGSDSRVTPLRRAARGGRGD